VALARHLIGAGETDAALALVAEQVAKRPWDPRRVKAHADLLDETERRDEALAAWRRAAKLAPGDLAIARWVASQAAESSPPDSGDAKAGGAFWAPYDEVLEDWLERVPETGPLVDNATAISVLDIAVTEYRIDGSWSEYVHQAHKLLTEKQKDDLAQVRVPGEAVALRTLLPDGTSLEPVAALSGGNYVMPGLVPGAYTEYAYRTDGAGRNGRAASHGRFFFQDFRYQQAFLLSRQVYILPPGFRGEVVEQGMRPDVDEVGLAQVEKTERELEDGRRVVIFETRNSPRLQQEGGMPGYESYVPNVQIRTRQTWRDVETQARRSVQNLTLPTPELERAAREATEGIDDPLAKAQKLYEYVNDLVPQQSGSRSAVAVLLEKAGDRTVLFKALLDAAGVPSRWAYLRPHESSFSDDTDWLAPSLSMFPYRRVLIELADREPVWVSLGYRYAPFGKIADTFSGGRALVVEPRGTRVLSLPTQRPREYETYVGADLDLREDGAVDVEMEMAMRGLGGYRAKEQFATMNAFQKNLVSRQMASQLFAGAKVESSGFPEIGEKGKPFRIALEVTAPRLLQKSKEHFALAPILQPLQMVRSFGGAPSREHPFHQRGRRVQRDRLTVDPGDAYRVMRLPDDVAIVHGLGTYSLRYISVAAEDGDGTGTLRIERDLQIEPGRLSAKEYPAFVEFLQAVDAAEQERIVFAKR